MDISVLYVCNMYDASVLCSQFQCLLDFPFHWRLVGMTISISTSRNCNFNFYCENTSRNSNFNFYYTEGRKLRAGLRILHVLRIYYLRQYNMMKNMSSLGFCNLTHRSTCLPRFASIAVQQHSFQGQ